LNKAIIGNVAVNISVQAVTMVAGFILPPLIIATYGSVQNGMVTSITQFIAYLSIVEAGVCGASIAALAKPLYDNDKNKINSVLAATQSFYSKAGTIFAALILILIFVYPYIIEDVDKFSAGLMVLVLSAGGVLDFFVIGKYRALLIADRKNFVLGIFKIITVILNTVISIILINLDNSLLFVKFISALIYASVYAMILIYVKKKYNFVNLKVEFDKNTLEQKWDVMYHRFGALVFYNSPFILLTIFCSLPDVSVYSIYAMVFFAVNQLIFTFSDGMLGFFGRLLAEDNPDKLKRIFGKYETAYFSVIGIGYTCALLLTIPFMRIYAKNMTDANYIRPTLVALFVIVGVMNNLRQPADALIFSAGHFKQTKWRAVTEALINILASTFFVIKFGMAGVLLGAICSFAYRTLDIMIYSSKHIVHNSLLVTLVKMIVLGTWYCAGYFFLSNYIISDISSYIDFIKNAGISIIFLAIPMLYIFGDSIKELNVRLFSHK
jgi:O-antigen/teichoic acid export membrane protein